MSDSLKRILKLEPREIPPDYDFKPTNVYAVLSASNDGLSITVSAEHLPDPSVELCFIDKDNVILFRERYFRCQDILVGFKGQSFMDAGYFYAPYVPLVSTPTIAETDLDKNKGILTRYGKKLLDSGNALYGKLSIITEPV